DLFVTGFVTAALCAFSLSVDDDDENWFLLAGALGGMALATKLTAGLALGPATIVFVLHRALNGTFRSAVRSAIKVLIPMTLIPAPWWGRNYVWTGNPFYPLFGGFFP